MALLICPPGNSFELLQSDISNQPVSNNQTPGFMHLFAKDDFIFKESIKTIPPLCRKNPVAIIWMLWHKKSSGIITCLTEDIIRRWALENNLVGNKISGK